MNFAIAILVYIGNEIGAASMNHEPPDPEYASAAIPPSLVLASGATDWPQLSEAGNGLFNASLDLQLEYCASVRAAAVATNRYFTARLEGDAAAADMQLTSVRHYVSRARLQQAPASESILDLAAAIVNTDADAPSDAEEVRAFQSELLRSERFPTALHESPRALRAGFDPQLLRIFDLHDIARRFALGMPANRVPKPSSEVLRAEAKAFVGLDRVIGPFPGVGSWF